MFHGFRWSDAAALCLVALIGTGMLLPAVGSACEKAARLSCEERLANLGKAVAQYEKAHGTLPKAGYWGPNGEGYGGWGVTLLPYVGEEALTKKYQVDKSWWTEENQAAARTFVSAYLCPASPEAKPVKNLKGLGDKDHPDREAAAGDYMVPRGYSDRRISQEGQIGPKGALGWFNETPRRADITDGASTTILVTEQAGRWGYYKFDKIQPTNDGQQYARWDGPWASYNAIWVKSGSDDGSDKPGSCIINCNNSSGLYSFHPAGVNAVFADGSVRLIGKKTDFRVVYALISRAGGELIGPGDY